MTRELAVVARLRAALDAAIVGHEDAKTALVLALVAREHALLLGPSGCGKTALAEEFVASASASGSGNGKGAARLAFHRDTRAGELLGDAVLVRTPHGRGERLALRTLPGALGEAPVWLLDDLSRAPGEALAPLLRLLAERSGPAGALALECAVATALPPSSALHADPLEPAQLDRFALQVRMRSLAGLADATQASALLMRAAGVAEPAGLSHAADNLGSDPKKFTNGPRGIAGSPISLHFLARGALSAAERAALQRAAAALALPDALREDWLALWRRLAALCASAGAAPPSDRALASAGLAVLRAHALVVGRSEVTRADLRAARFMLAARVPESLLRAAEQLVERAAAGELAPPATTALAGRAVPGDAGRTPQRPRPAPPAAERTAAVSPLAAARHRPEPADVAPLARALAGRIDRAKAERAPDPGGAPRRRSALRQLGDAADADPAELALWVAASWPAAPALLRRERRGAGGALVLLRDVSASMEGARTRLAADVIAGVLRAAARRRMRVGYVEFHHAAEPVLVDGALFHRRYRALLERAQLARAEGRTSYEAPLRVALEALRERDADRGHILLLTDGVPVVGDPRVARARRLATELGARIHSVFLGVEETPALLRELSAETGGVCFRVETVRGRSRLCAVGARPPVAARVGLR